MKAVAAEMFSNRSGTESLHQAVFFGERRISTWGLFLGFSKFAILHSVIIRGFYFSYMRENRAFWCFGVFGSRL